MFFLVMHKVQYKEYPLLFPALIYIFRFSIIYSSEVKDCSGYNYFAGMHLCFEQSIIFAGR